MYVTKLINILHYIIPPLFVTNHLNSLVTKVFITDALLWKGYYYTGAQLIQLLSCKNMALRGIRVRATELGGRTMLDGLQDIIFSNNMKS